MTQQACVKAVAGNGNCSSPLQWEDVMHEAGDD